MSTGVFHEAIRVKGSIHTDEESRSVKAPDHAVAVGVLMDWIEERFGRRPVNAVGHRLVHGWPQYVAQRITPDTVEDLRRLSPVDPEHLPGETRLTEGDLDPGLGGYHQPDSARSLQFLDQVLDGGRTARPFAGERLRLFPAADRRR